MAEQSFSWLPEDHEAEKPKSTKLESPQDKKKSWENLKSFFFSQKTGFFIVPLLLISLLALKTLSTKEKDSPNHQIEIMTSTLPLSKGSPLEAAFLRPVLFNEFSLSKIQKMEALTFEAAEKVMGKVKAKKDIPPHKPIFWNDLELIQESKKPLTTLKPNIFYSEESQ
jgi:hypothetical protein